MSTFSIQRPEFVRFSYNGSSNHHKFHRVAASRTMTMNSNSSQTWKKEELLMKLPELPAPPSALISQSESLITDDLQFDRLQPSDEDLIHKHTFEFGHFVAREAVLDEEYWTAAWLRAEIHWENRTNERYVDNHKRKHADQEFTAIKKRCRGEHGQTCSCIVAVKKENKNIKRIVLKSIVGTLDLSIRNLLHGETFPRERVRGPLFCSRNRTCRNRYGYIANLCVAKAARRQGIASNMLSFAVESAKSNGVEQVYVHVHRNNIPAHDLYQKIGFKMVDIANSQLLDDQTYLLCLKI